MQLWYGGVAFPVNACEVVRNAASQVNDEGSPYETTWTYQVVCDLIPPPGLTAAQIQRDLSIREAVFRSALETPGQDLVLVADDGLPTDLALRNTPDILDRQGVHLVGFASPDGGNVQLSGKRTLSFVMQATYAVRGSLGALVSFGESISTTGTGGPMVVNRITTSGGIRQKPFGESMCHATQSGSAVGYLGWPNLGGPGGGPRYRFPVDDLKPDSATITRQEPRHRGRIRTHYGMSWSYVYERSGLSFKP